MSDGLNGSLLSQVISSRSSFSPSSEQWRRRASVHSPSAKAKVSNHATKLLVLNAVVFLASRLVPFSASVSVAVLCVSLGYAWKDTAMLLASRSRNNSLASELLVFILRRLFTTAAFQEALRKGLCSIRAGEDFQPTSIEWPSDLVLQKMDRPQVEAILKSLLLYPKTRDLDPFVCSLGMALAQRDPDFYDDIPLVNPLCQEEDFVFPTCVGMNRWFTWCCSQP